MKNFGVLPEGSLKPSKDRKKYINSRRGNYQTEGREGRTAERRIGLRAKQKKKKRLLLASHRANLQQSQGGSTWPR